MFGARLQTAYSPHSQLAALGTAALFVVASVRLWILSRADTSHVYPDWRQGFVRARMSSEGSLAFNTFCNIVTTATWRSLDVRALYCSLLGRQEASILQTTALLQQGYGLAAEATLCSWCPPAAARLAIEPARAFALALRSRHLWMSFRYPDPPTERQHPDPCEALASTRIH
ncbi:MAG TPA: hypothetical protein VGC34_08035 [Steroidobacteraceae bacterium]